MGDVPSKEGDRVARDFNVVNSPLYSSKLPQRDIRLSRGHLELIWPLMGSRGVRDG